MTDKTPEGLDRFLANEHKSEHEKYRGSITVRDGDDIDRSLNQLKAFIEFAQAENPNFAFRLDIQFTCLQNLTHLIEPE